MTTILESISLSKRYLSRENQSEYTLKKMLHDSLSFKWNRLQKKPILALNKVSFALREGDIVALLGRNGSGKSTLLKVISGITQPSEGKLYCRGKVGALLEIGVGMLPDFSGRDNIYFYGALLGMKRNDIKTHFDQIVEFAEIENFIDIPIKKYSSGMVLRLASAVVFHLNTNLIILDEILAVGDQSFREKSVAKIKQLAKEGRIIICVSHQLDWINSLCTRALLLDRGSLLLDGNVTEALKMYESAQTNFSDKTNNNPL